VIFDNLKDDKSRLSAPLLKAIFMLVFDLLPKNYKDLNSSALPTAYLRYLYTLYKEIYPVNGQDYLKNSIY
jgi:hypothetical protein